MESSKHWKVIGFIPFKKFSWLQVLKSFVLMQKINVNFKIMCQSGNFEFLKF